MNDLVDLANAILSKTPLNEAQAKLYAAVHVVTNGVTYGARAVTPELVDLVDDRVNNEPYEKPETATPAAPATDELAAMRQQMADLQKVVAGKKKTTATARRKAK
jgi:hypothetical protein